MAVAELEKDMQSQSTPLEMENVRRVLDSRFERISKNTDVFDDSGEKAFAAWAKKQYKGICGKCGEYGHSSNNCPNSKPNRFKSQNSGDYKSNNSEKTSSRDGKTSNKICSWCGRYGHTAKYCKSRNQRERFLNKQKERGNAAIDKVEETDEDYESENESVAEVGFVAKEVEPERGLACVVDGMTYPSFTDDTMFGDSGSSCHIRNSAEGMFDVEDIDDQIGGVGNNIRATRKGKLKVEVVQADGSSSTRILSPVKYSKDAQENLLSITAEMTAGAKLSSTDNNEIQLVYPDGDTVTFDRRIKTKDGWVSGVDIKPIIDKPAKQEQALVASQVTRDINEYHRQLGHPNERITRTTAKAFGIKLTGKFQKCEDCAIAKARQKNVKKIPSKKAKHPGGRISLDISSPNYKGVAGKRHWLLFLDEHSDMVWSRFPKQKSDLPAIAMAFIKELEQENDIKVASIRLDNSGENRALEAACKQEGLGIKFEFTAPNTPEQNGRVERKFATLYGRMRAMMSAMPKQGTNTLWTEAAETATDLDNLIVRQGETKNSYQKFYGDDKKCFATMDNLKTFGEEVVVANRSKIKAKLCDRGKKCLWLGYAKNRSSDTYRLYNPKTRSIILSRDVTFLNQEKATENKTPIPESKQDSQETKEASQTEEEKPTMTWSRTDRGAKCFMTTKKYGPNWDTVTRRVTRNLDTGDVIDDHKIEWNSSKQYNKFLHRPLPEGVTDIETTLYHRDPNAIQDMPTFASVNYVSDDENEDKDNDEPPPLLTRSDSSDEEDDEDQATKIARSKSKVERAMKKLSGTSYNPMPGRVLQAGTYRPTRSSSRLGRNRNVQELANLVTDFQSISKENSQIVQKYKEPKNF